MKTQAMKKKPQVRKTAEPPAKIRATSKAGLHKADQKPKPSLKKAKPVKSPASSKTRKTPEPVSRVKRAASASAEKERKTSSARKSETETRPERQGDAGSASEPSKAVKAEKPPVGPQAKGNKKAAKVVNAKQKDESDKALIKFDPLQRYLSEISKYRLLTREEERDYGIRVKEKGDKEAAYSLVTANLRLVVKIALEFQRVWMQNLLDLIQEGNIGLMQAVKKFDPYKNVKFSYYASFWIKAYILKFIMDNWRLVKIGTTQGQRKLFFKLKKEKQRLIDQGFDPKPKLLSERLGVSEREIVDMDQRLDGWDVSLDAPLKNDSETERIEFISTDNESVEEQVSKKEIEMLLHNKISEFRKKMTSRETEIFELRIFSDNPVTLQEIGDRYGISRERVRQIEKNIIRKMREFFKREIPDFASYSENTGTE